MYFCLTEWAITIYKNVAELQAWSRLASPTCAEHHFELLKTDVEIKANKPSVIEEQQSIGVCC